MFKVIIGIVITLVLIIAGLYFIPLYKQNTQSCINKSYRFSVISGGGNSQVDNKIKEIDEDNSTKDCDVKNVYVVLYFI